MATGKINVHTENIFPIIKKFLYSDQEIFLRELVSNAVDATQKLKTLSGLGEVKGEVGDAAVTVSFDKEKKTITISDQGIGMTAEEVEKYINQVAFSGAEEFVQKYKDKGGAAIIGHFGLGFYSAFMVAERVELITRSHTTDNPDEAVRWECDGSPEYSLEKTTRDTRGTDVILHIAPDGEEFLEEARLQTILKKYCRFLPVPIFFGGEQINNPTPAWTRPPAELNDEDYTNFYKELYPFSEDPLFHIHLNVDYPFNLTGILYFPRLKNNLEVQKNKIQLYANQVYVTDSVEGIVPDFLTLLHGVLDSPDIPLNVSRSYLQSDGNVKKISSHITKKVADKLESLFKADREAFASKWKDIRMFIEYGILTDEKFAEKADKFMLFKNMGGENFLLDEYLEKIAPLQTDKDGDRVVLYTSDKEAHHMFIHAATEKGFDVLELDSPFTAHLIGRLEQKNEKVRFARVDADVPDKLIPRNEETPEKLNEEEKEKLKPVMEAVLPQKNFAVRFESMAETDQPALVTRSEFMRRMKEMSQFGGSPMGELPESFEFIVNSNHPVIGKILQETNEEKQKEMARQVSDLALLAQHLLKGEELSAFIRRNIDKMKNEN